MWGRVKETGATKAMKEETGAIGAIGAAEVKPFQPYLEYEDKAGRVYHMNVRVRLKI